MPVKVQPGFVKELKRVRRAHVLIGAESEIELPGTDAGWVIAVLVCQCYAKLDELEQVNVASQGLVMIVGGAFKGPDWPGYDPGKFSIL